MIKMFKNHVKELVEDINGNHVIQKSLNCFVAPFNDFIFDEMIEGSEPKFYVKPYYPDLDTITLYIESDERFFGKDII